MDWETILLRLSALSGGEKKVIWGFRGYNKFNTNSHISFIWGQETLSISGDFIVGIPLICPLCKPDIV
jgi:hypothetical protein